MHANGQVSAGLKRLLTFCLSCLLCTGVIGADHRLLQDYAGKISNLIAPAKLATLGERGANQRVQKYVALLAEARSHGVVPRKAAGRAVGIAGMRGEAARLTAKGMLRKLEIAERLGCLDDEGLRNMRKGGAAIVRRGSDRGDELSVDHIIPRSVLPELDNVIANLELMPLRANERKNANLGARQLDLGRKLQRAGLLSKEGLRLLESRAGQVYRHHARYAEPPDLRPLCPGLAISESELSAYDWPFECGLEIDTPASFLRQPRAGDDFQHVERLLRGDQHLPPSCQAFGSQRRSLLPNITLGVDGVPLELRLLAGRHIHSLWCPVVTHKPHETARADDRDGVPLLATAFVSVRVEIVKS